MEALDRAKARLVADLETQLPGSAKVRGMIRIARLRQIGGVAPFGDSIRTTPEGSFEDVRQEAAVAKMGSSSVGSKRLAREAANDGLPLPADIEFLEDEMDSFGDCHAAAPPTKRKYTRSSDPKVLSTPSSNAKASSKGRKATPRTTVSSTGDSIDFYSDEVMA